MKTSPVSDGRPFCLAQEETTNSCKDFFQTSIGSASPLRLSGIDSLAVMTLCRQLRLAAPGHKCLRPMEVFQCSTVAELLDLVDSKEVLDVPAVVEANGDFGQARTIWFAPGQVDNTCKWLYGCRGLLDPECFRRAAARLLARHEGLRAEMEPGGGGWKVGPFRVVYARCVNMMTSTKIVGNILDPVTADVFMPAIDCFDSEALQVCRFFVSYGMWVLCKQCFGNVWRQQ